MCGTAMQRFHLGLMALLQRPDMDGVLDGEYDLLPRIAPNLGKPLAWCKTTISSFRLSELMRHYEDEGWRFPLS